MDQCGDEGSKWFRSFWEGILARFKIFDFRGTIGGTQKSGQSEYTNQERNSVSPLAGRSDKLRSTVPKSHHDWVNDILTARERRAAAYRDRVRPSLT
jgi:hypothetical protein